MGFPSSQFRETQFCPPEKDRRTYSVSLRGKRSQKPQEGSNLQHFEPVLSVHRRLGGACGCYTPGAHESEPFSPEQTPRQLGNSCYRPPPAPRLALRISWWPLGCSSLLQPECKASCLQTAQSLYGIFRRSMYLHSTLYPPVPSKTLRVSQNTAT